MKTFYQIISPCIFFLVFTLGYSQSNNTVTFTGNSSDFNLAEKIYGGDNVDYYVTFDDTYMYFGAFRVNAQFFNSFDHFTVYIDSDPQNAITTGNGSTTGLAWDSNTPSLAFNADHRFAIRNNSSGESFHHKFTGSSWDDQTGGSISSFTQFTTSTALEIRIPKTDIDSANGIYFVMYMSFNGGFFGANDIGYPISISGSTISGYFGGIGLNAEDCTPISSSNNPITGTLTNTNPTSGGKYAHIQIDNTDSSVTGDIEIVTGGTMFIDSGYSLTVNGNLLNNGSISLNSTSSSYSSLIPSSISGSGTVFYSRYTNIVGSGTTGGNDLVSPPVSNQTLGDFAAANSNLATDGTKVAFGRFDNSLNPGDYVNYDIITNGSNTFLKSFWGYRAATTDGSNLTFKGTINTGVSSSVITEESGTYGIWNLMGNPYPSYVRLGDLLANNISQFDPSFVGIYGYDGSASNGWTIWDSNSNQDLLIAPGQGFFVASKSGGGMLSFTASMRRIGTSDDFISDRTANENYAYTKLVLTDSENSFDTNIYFRDFNTRGLDPGYDTGAHFGEASGIFTHLLENNVGVELYNQSLPLANLNNIVVPLGINSPSGEQITISLDSGFSLPNDINVYLEDNVANQWILLNTNDYVFTPSTNLNGTGRFFVHFTTSTLSAEETIYNGLQIYANNASREVVIKGQLNANATASIYDIQGRQVLNKELNGELISNRIDINNFSSGLYIVEISDYNKKRTQKIIIK